MADVYSSLGYRIPPPTINNREGYQWEFTPAETLKLRADWYYNQWDTALWDAYSALWSWSDAFSNTANQINSFYSVLADDILNREWMLASQKYALANKLNEDLLSSREYVMDMFGPNGTLTREVNQYYDDLWNYLATDAGRQAAKIAAQWIHTWASLWAIRAQQNEAYNESFARYVQAKEQEINAKQQIASNLINYMSTLRKEYWDTTNAYIIQQYQRANDLLNSLSQSIADNNAQLASLKLTNSLRWSSSSGSSSTINLLDNLIRWDISKEDIQNLLKGTTTNTNKENNENSNDTNSVNYRTSVPANKWGGGNAR